MKTTFVFFALIACFPHTIKAQDYASVPHTDIENADKDQLLAILDEQTAIATHTRMNADYMPGMVTVLRGNDLEARGIRTVWEALALVPGMETAMEKTGRRKVLVRGLGNIWASGNIKILLNEISMNSAELGLADPVFNMAIEQVDRIEVIRGPGSAVYGEYAYMGVINVVTRSDRPRVFAFGGTFDNELDRGFYGYTAGAGAILAFSSPDSAVKASLNLASWRSSGADVQTGPDYLHFVGLEDLSYAPGRANEDVEAGTVVFKLDYDRFSFIVQQSQDGLGDHFGINEFLPPNPNQIVERWRHRTVNMRQEIPLTSSLSAGIDLGWKDLEQRRDDLYVIPGGIEDTTGNLFTSEDVYLDSRYREASLSWGADFVYRGWGKHTAFLAASSNKVRVEHSSSVFSPTLPTEAIIIPEGTTRTIRAITLQDEYRHSDFFTLTTGLRYDEYSDAGINYSPRIAGVWRLNPRHILKAQYAEAFRPPTLYEQSNEVFFGVELKPARIQTSEIGYTFKGDRAETRLTAFYSHLKDLVVFNPHPGTDSSFGNEGATTAGVEWEQIWRPSPHWVFDANVSYVDTRDKRTGEPFPGASQWLVNFGPSYERDKLTISTQAHHVSGYEREPDDSRETLHGYTTVDLTATLSHLFAHRLQLRAGIKNLLDADVRYPACYNSYPDDFPRAGRSWWTQLSYHY